MKASKKLIASAVCVSMLASLGGCAMFDKDDEGVLKAAEDYATAIQKVKLGDITDLMTNGDDLADTLDYLVNDTENMPAEYSDICAAIASTISYEIDEESVQSSKKNAEGSVDVTWTLVDYDAIFDQVSEDGGDADAFIDALTADDADTQEISTTINFVLEDETWLVDDEDGDVLNEVYAFYADAADYSFVPPLMDYIEDAYWYYSDDSVYTNFSQIELDIITTTEGEEIPFEFTYEYYLNGELIYTSDVCTDQGHWIEAYYGPNYDPAAQVDANGNLIAGEYRCVMYDLAGNVLADLTCTVETLEYSEADASMIDDVVWYWTDDDDTYIDTDSIELDIIPTSEGQECIWNFYYEIYIDGDLVYTSGAMEDQGYWIEAYYSEYYDDEIQLTDDGNLIPGEYTCIFYDLSGNEIASSTCTVEVS